MNILNIDLDLGSLGGCSCGWPYMIDLLLSKRKRIESPEIVSLLLFGREVCKARWRKLISKSDLGYTPETNILAPEKRPGTPKGNESSSNHAFFRGKFAVRFREGKY